MTLRLVISWYFFLAQSYIEFSFVSFHVSVHVENNSFIVVSFKPQISCVFSTPLALSILTSFQGLYIAGVGLNNQFSLNCCISILQ